MFKPKTFLKVISVLFIIGGVFGMFGTAVSYIMLPKISEVPGIDMAMIKDTLTTFNLVMSLISGVSMVTAGVMGFCGKSMRWAVIAGGVYTLLLFVSFVRMLINGTFTFFVFIDFIIPALYWWGLYQSQE